MSPHYNEPSHPSEYAAARYPEYRASRLLGFSYDQIREYVGRSVREHRPPSKDLIVANYLLTLYEVERNVGRVSSFPQTIGLAITDVCNARCDFCAYVPERVLSRSLSLDDLRGADWLKYCHSIAFNAGLGEPFAHPKVLELLSLARKLAPHARFISITNGSLLRDKVIDVLAGWATSLNLSLNAATKETYEVTMHPLKWDRTMANLRRLRDKKRELGTDRPRLRASYVVHTNNLRELPTLPAQLAELDIRHLNVNYMMPPPFSASRELLTRDHTIFTVPEVADQSFRETERECALHGIELSKALPSREALLGEQPREVSIELDDQSAEELYEPETLASHNGGESGRPAVSHEFHSAFLAGRPISCWKPWTGLSTDIFSRTFVCCSFFDRLPTFDWPTAERFHREDGMWNHPVMQHFRKTLNTPQEFPFCTFCKTADKRDSRNAKKRQRAARESQRVVAEIEDQHLGFQRKGRADQVGDLREFLTPGASKPLFRMGKAYYRNRLRRLKLFNLGKVLQLGCGNGSWSVFLAENNGQLTLVDRSAKSLAAASALLGSLGLERHDSLEWQGRRLPLESGSFDGVWLTGRLLSRSARHRMLWEMNRVLGESGRLHISGYPGPGAVVLDYARALRSGDERRAEQCLSALEKGPLYNQDPNFVTMASLASVLKLYGFETDKTIPPGISRIGKSPRVFADLGRSPAEMAQRLRREGKGLVDQLTADSDLLLGSESSHVFTALRRGEPLGEEPEWREPIRKVPRKRAKQRPTRAQLATTTLARQRRLASELCAAPAAELQLAHPGFVRRGSLDGIDDLQAWDLDGVRPFGRSHESYRRELHLQGAFNVDRVLELGCGLGAWSCFLAENNRELVVVDPSSASLARSSRLLSGFELENFTALEWSGRPLDLESSSFDVVWVNGSQLSRMARERGLWEANRLLRPGGLLAVYGYPGPGALVLRYSRWQLSGQSAAAEAVLTSLERGPKFEGVGNFLDQRSLRSLLRLYGFRPGSIPARVTHLGEAGARPELGRGPVSMARRLRREGATLLPDLMADSGLLSGIERTLAFSGLRVGAPEIAEPSWRPKARPGARRPKKSAKKTRKKKLRRKKRSPAEQLALRVAEARRSARERSTMSCAELAEVYPGYERRGRLDRVDDLRAWDLDGVRPFGRSHEDYRRELHLQGAFNVDRVLELGCGLGAWSCFLAENNRELVVVDPSSASLARSSRLLSGFELENFTALEWSGRPLDLESSSFDVVWVNGSQLSRMARERGLWEANRLLRPGGLLAVYGYPGPGALVLRYSRWQLSGQSAAAEAVLTSLERGPKFEGVGNFLDQRSLRSLLRLYGFRPGSIPARVTHLGEAGARPELGRGPVSMARRLRREGATLLPDLMADSGLLSGIERTLAFSGLRVGAPEIAEPSWRPKARPGARRPKKSAKKTRKKKLRRKKRSPAEQLALRVAEARRSARERSTMSCAELAEVYPGYERRGRLDRVDDLRAWDLDGVRPFGRSHEDYRRELHLQGAFNVDRVLELGCGLGAWSCFLAENNRELVVVDPSSASLARSSRLLSGFELENFTALEWSGRPLDLESSSFDVVWVNGSQLSRMARERGLWEANRLLRPGGLLAVYGYPGPGALVLRYSRWQLSGQSAAAEAVLTSLERGPKFEGVGNFLDQRSLRSLLRLYGFRPGSIPARVTHLGEAGARPELGRGPVSMARRLRREGATLLPDLMADSGLLSGIERTLAFSGLRVGAPEIAEPSWRPKARPGARRPKKSAKKTRKKKLRRKKRSPAEQLALRVAEARRSARERSTMSCAELAEVYPGYERRGRLDRVDDLRAWDLDGVRPFGRSHESYRRELHLQGAFNVDRVLELGCGLGAWSCFLAENNRELVVVDPSSASLARSSRLLSGFELENFTALEWSGRPLDLESASFDVVWIHGGVLGRSRRERCLWEANRLLRPNGRAFVYGYPGPGSVVLEWKRLTEQGRSASAAELVTALARGAKTDGTPNYIDKRSLHPMLARFGFGIARDLPPVTVCLGLDGAAPGLGRGPVSMARRLRRHGSDLLAELTPESSLLSGTVRTLSFSAIRSGSPRVDEPGWSPRSIAAKKKAAKKNTKPSRKATANKKQPPDSKKTRSRKKVVKKGLGKKKA